MTTMYPTKTTRAFRTGREMPALSLDFVITEREIMSRTPEDIAAWVAKAAERVLYSFKGEELLKRALDTGNEA